LLSRRPYVHPSASSVIAAFAAIRHNFKRRSLIKTSCYDLAIPIDMNWIFVFGVGNFSEDSVARARVSVIWTSRAQGLLRDANRTLQGTVLFLKLYEFGALLAVRFVSVRATNKILRGYPLESGM
jgi:hypothetical protein